MVFYNIFDISLKCYPITIFFYLWRLLFANMIHTMENKTDTFIDAIRNGDRAGIEKIYADFFPRIAHLITKNGGSVDDARDIFQDAILLLYEKAKSPAFSLTSSFYTLLHGICRNLLGNKLQKKANQEVTLPDHIKLIGEDDIAKDLIMLEENEVFWRAFQQLGADCQKLLTLFFEKVKMKEITREMGFGSENYAKKRKYQCKEKLIELVTADARFEELKR